MTNKANDGSFLLRLRYSTDPDADTFFEWRGSVFAFIPGEPPKRVFECVGMNVGKATIKDGKVVSTSRELTYYLDPQTHEKLVQWENPWTGEKLSVMHIANDPVQMALPCAIPLNVRPDPFTGMSRLVTEIPLFYPNPLATREGTFDEYDSSKMYQAGEFFTFTCPTASIEQNDGTIDKVQINWTRISRFPPFMKMGNKQGYLVYHCTGYKLPPNATFRDLQSPVLVKEIEARVPTYAHAPEAYDPNVKSVSSWSYFRQHFEEYKNNPDLEWPPKEQ